MSKTTWMFAWGVMCVACNSTPPPPPPVDSGPPPPCPVAPPNAGDSCDAGYQCEYGSDPNVACNSVYECGGGAWSPTTPPTDAGACPTTDPGLPADCPKKIPTGSCGSDASTLCHYPTGYCACVGSDINMHWACDSQDPHCPNPRPTLGTACGDDQYRCYYLQCNVPWGVSLICTGGTWQIDTTAPCADD